MPEVRIARKNLAQYLFNYLGEIVTNGSVIFSAISKDSKISKQTEDRQVKARTIVTLIIVFNLWNRMSALRTSTLDVDLPSRKGTLSPRG